MTNYKQKMITLMAFSSIAICAAFILVSNVIAMSYIDSQASNTIKTEIELASQQQNYIGEIGDIIVDEAENFNIIDPIISATGEIEDRTFTVNRLWPTELEIMKSQSKIFHNEEYEKLYQLYKSGDLDDDKIVKKEIKGNLYYIALSESPTIFVEENDTVKSITEPTILYVNVSTVQNLVKKFNYYLLPIMLIAVALMAFVGMHTGRKIEDSQRKLKSFFQNASHELKTPLQSIQGYAEGLNTGVIKDKNMATSVIMSQSDKMSYLIDEILTVSKLESGEYTMKHDNIYLPDILYECLYLHKPMASKKGVSIVPHIPEDLAQIVGDESQLSKVFNAVLSNAVRFAKNKIELITFDDKRRVTVIISDDGEGISEEDMPYIFERFYSANNQGTGIGLSMSKEILNLSRGTIQARNGNKGAEFIITLQRY